MKTDELIVSSAALNNWKRLNISDEEIKTKLSKRANKSQSTKNIIPSEYFKNSENKIVLKDLITVLKKKQTSIESIIYGLALNLLNAQGLIKIKNDEIKTKNKYLKEILLDFGNYDIDLLYVKLPDDEIDILGIVYQMLLYEGEKNKCGSYYTPQKIIQKIVKNILSGSSYLDPCCGTGSFLLGVSDRITEPENLYGVDNDRIACFISKINLILRFKNKVFSPNIFHADFLSDEIFDEKKFDFIGTNPPWSRKKSKKYENNFPEIESGEIFSYFIVRAEKFLKNGGKCAFVLPSSVINTRVHYDVRKFIFDHFSINKIEFESRVFSNVLTDTVILSLSKDIKNVRVEINNKGKKFHVRPKILTQNLSSGFTLLEDIDSQILDKIFSVKYETLSQSIWAMGIVTGNNSKHIKYTPVSGEKIYTGKNITPYFIGDTDMYIDYKRENFQQTANDNIYRAGVKLVYRFISTRPVFGYDDKKRLFLNSANILIPKLKTQSAKTALVFLNSKVFYYIYSKKFGGLKVLKSHLLQMPFPEISTTEREKLETLCDKYLDTKDYRVQNEIDRMVFDLFNLDKDEIVHITKNV